MGGDIVDSQSSINQQLAGAMSFSINPIYCLEQTLGSVNNVYKLLANNKKIDGPTIRNLADGKTKFFSHTKKEYNLVQAESHGINKAAINLVTASNKKLLAGRLNILSAIEGVHGLFSTNDDYAGRFTDSFYRRLKKQFVGWAPAYLTLSHMHQNRIFSFCNGVKQTNKKQSAWFVPYNRGFEGLDEHGKRILTLCEEHRVSVDLKHTSFANRIAIYEYMHDQEMSAPIASHCGIAFMSFADYLVHNNVEKRIRKIRPFPAHKVGNTTPVPEEKVVDMIINRAKGPLNLFGNCNQINLFDEDIVAIMKMGGLIGVSLDQRILGATGLFTNLRQQVDQISREDGNYVIKSYNKIIRTKLGLDFEKFPTRSLGVQQGMRTAGLLDDLIEVVRDKENHLRYFIQTFLYLLKIGYENNIPTPWKHICLGSDFDGLINAVDVCKKASDYPRLRSKFLDYCLQNQDKKTVLKLVQKDGITMVDLIEHISFFNPIEFFSQRMELDATDLLTNTIGIR